MINKKCYFTNVNYIGNVGDYWSSPLKYYDFNMINYEHVHYLDIFRGISNDNFFNKYKIKNSIVIIGGGGLMADDNTNIQKTFKYLLDNNLVILWGVGYQTGIKINHDLLDHPNVKLYGIRDYDYNFNFNNNYLPCVSCKNQLFEHYKDNIITDDIGIYEHKDYPINIDRYLKIDNSYDIDDVIKFISSKNIVITNSYHGVYWSQLLNKKVLYYTDTNIANYKFLNLKNRVFICNKDNYYNKIKNLSNIQGFLEECISLNDSFYNKVVELIKSVNNIEINTYTDLNVNFDNDNNKIHIESKYDINAQLSFYELDNNRFNHLYTTNTSFKNGIKYFYSLYKGIKNIKVLKILVRTNNNTKELIFDNLHKN